MDFSYQYTPLALHLYVIHTGFQRTVILLLFFLPRLSAAVFSPRSEQIVFVKNSRKTHIVDLLTQILCKKNCFTSESEILRAKSECVIDVSSFIYYCLLQCVCLCSVMPALSLMLHLIPNSHGPADQSISPERVCLCLYVSTNMHICVGVGVCSDLWFHIRYVSHAVDFFSYHHLSEFPLSLVCKNTLFHVAKSTLPLIDLRFSSSLSYHEILQQIHDEPELLF